MVIVEFLRFYDYHQSCEKTVEVIQTTELIDCACGCGQKRPRFNKRGIERRYIKWHGRPREQHHNWKDGTKINREGYKLIKLRGHRMANTSGYVLEHRLVWEEYHKVCLLPWADVHHINGIRNDNRPENLDAMMNWQHASITHTVNMNDRVCIRCKRTYEELKNQIKNYRLWFKNKSGFICFGCRK